MPLWVTLIGTQKLAFRCNEQYNCGMCDTLITKAEATRLSGLDRRTINRRINLGLIKAQPPPGLNRLGVSKNGLDDFMAFIRPAEMAANRYIGRGLTNADPTSHAYLYEIRDPKDGQCVYVGFSKNAISRIRQHKSELGRGKHGNRQLQHLHDARNGKLKYKVVAEGMSQLMLDMEKRAIADLKKQIGDRLCNATDGGDGFDSLPEKTKRAIAQNSRDKWRDDQYRRRWYAAQGKPFVSYQDSMLDKWAKACKAVQRACDRDKPKPKPKPKPRVDYTKDDLVLPTVGGAILFPAKRHGVLYWCSVAIGRAEEVIGHKWTIVSHNYNRYRVKRNSKDGIIVPKKPYTMPSSFEASTALLPEMDCPRCGEQFQCSKYNQVYCSVKCQKAMRERRKYMSAKARRSAKAARPQQTPSRMGRGVPRLAPS